MAGRTTAWCHARMAERGRDPRSGPVTGIARGRRRHVRRGLPSRRIAVMTGRTGPGCHPRVAEGGRNPTRRPMASITRGRRRDVRRSLPRCLVAVVAGDTGSGSYACVGIPPTDQHPIWHAHPVAGIAGGRCRDMGSRLPARLNTVMARRASSRRNPDMPKGCSSPSDCAMTRIASQRRGQMARGFSGCYRIVMTLRAGRRGNPRVSEAGRAPARSSMTTIAIRGGRDVIRRLVAGYHSTTRRMALVTLRGRPPENTLNVAALALDLRMASGKREAGRGVLELHVAPILTESLRNAALSPLQAEDKEEDGGEPNRHLPDPPKKRCIHGKQKGTPYSLSRSSSSASSRYAIGIPDTIAPDMPIHGHDTGKNTMFSGIVAGQKSLFSCAKRHPES